MSFLPCPARGKHSMLHGAARSKISASHQEVRGTSAHRAKLKGRSSPCIRKFSTCLDLILSQPSTCP